MHNLIKRVLRQIKTEKVAKDLVNSPLDYDSLKKLGQDVGRTIDIIRPDGTMIRIWKDDFRGLEDPEKGLYY